MPKRPKDQERESVKGGFRFVGEPDISYKKMGSVVEATLYRRSRVRPHSVEELAGIWTLDNFPSEDVARILEIAKEAFDDSEKALRWLQEPNIQTGKKPPVSLIGTPEGFATVESVLRQIQYGVFG